MPINTGVWSKINKGKIEQLIKKGLMAKAGYETIEIAKQNGAWYTLDEIEEMVIPPDLQEELDSRPKANEYYMNLARSTRKNMLQWLVLAKRPKTRQKRITELIKLAEQGQKPKQIRQV